MHFEPRDTEGHHDVRDGMRLREEVGYLAAGLDVPVRYALVSHLLLGIAGELAALLYLALTHGLHGLECKRGRDADGDEVDHDIVAAADRLVNGSDAVDYQVADVARPDVGAVREAGQPYQRVKLLGLRIHKHLPRERRTELGYADGAGLADYRVVVRQPQHGGACEYRHGVGVGEQYLLRVDPLAHLLGQILHHAYHGRVIMPQLVELEEVRLHAVIFKMSGDNVAVRVVCRMLDGAEIRHVHVLRHDDEAAWVLTRGALDADKPQREAVLLGLGRLYPALLKIFLDIAVGGLFGEGAYRSGAENMVGAEQRLGIFMRLGLIFAGEVEVNIGGLFVAWEAEEGLERDIEAVTVHARAAFGAVLFGHIRAATVAAVGDELRVLALGADVVRREGVDLRDT